MFLGRRTPAIIFFRFGLGCLSLLGILCGFSLSGAAQDWQPKIANDGENAPSQRPKANPSRRAAEDRSAFHWVRQRDRPR